ncbi:MAG: (2Fe-2S) ferredoxin domain-containing protein [Burkholderiaceae bacterium]
MSSHYSHHVFFCTNVREPDPSGYTRPCCGRHQAAEMRDYTKKRVKALGLAGPGKVRVNNAGCLDRCEEGPCIVIYPEAVWYTYVDQEDLDEIIDSHLVQGKIVDRLKI